jgi:hypothetical protein
VAQKVTVQLVDDLDGRKADETVDFGLDGVQYVIDLSKENAGRLREALAPFVDKGRREGGRAKPGSKRPGGQAAPKRDRAQVRAIREWARKKGLPVSDRGRVPQDVLDQFEAEHKAG